MFNLEKLVKLGELHYQDFTVVEIYIVHVRRHVDFSTCEDILSLSIMML
jgi:elongation factor P--beta-lysine ligase